MKFLSLFLALTLLSVPAFAEESDLQSKKATEDIVIQTQTQSLPFKVELALTKQEQNKGLQMRNSLEDNAGMLFMFKTPGTPKFWMKDTFISLDMIYIDQTGTIVGIHPKAIPLDKTPIDAPAECSAVLEIAGGAAQKLGISTGDTVIHRFFKKVTK